MEKRVRSQLDLKNDAENGPKWAPRGRPNRLKVDFCRVGSLLENGLAKKTSTASDEGEVSAQVGPVGEGRVGGKPPTLAMSLKYY